MRKAFANQHAHDTRDFATSLLPLFENPITRTPRPIKGVAHPAGTASRERILAFMASYTDAHGMPPTIREMCNAVGLSSPSSVKAHLDFLAREGRVVHESQKPRSYRLANHRSWLADLADHLHAASAAAEGLEEGQRKASATDLRGHLEKAQAILAQRMAA